MKPAKLGAFCAIGATVLGLVYLAAAGAPSRFLAINAGALVAGFLVALLVRLPAGGAASLALGFGLLLVSLFGARIDGATRWLIVGGLSLQPSFLVMPFVALSFARRRDWLSLGGVLLASLALAVQLDRAMAGTLAFGMAILAVIRTERAVWVALAAAVAGFIATLFRGDTLPAMPYVEGILYSSFTVHPLAGLAVWCGVALLIVPAIAGLRRDGENREACAVFAAVWLGLIIAAAAGNYPTPVVGYGGSAIIGYAVSLVCLDGNGAGRGT
jgi:hypothetical protein